MATKTPSKSLIVTALAIEREAVVRHLTDIKLDRSTTGAVYHIGNFLSWSVCVAQVAAGNSSAALETEKALRHFDPDLALFVGIGGGVKDVQLGDVVAATKVYGYERGADRKHFQPRPESFLTSYPLVQEAQVIALDHKWHDRIHVKPSAALPRFYLGAVAAGEKVIKSTRGSVADLLRKHYGDTLAVEMEGEGFMRAAYTNQVDSMVIRGISDLLDGKAEADKSGSQQVASDHAAAFAFELLYRLSRESAVAVALRVVREGAVENDVPNDFWTRLGELAPRLYPRGPDDGGLWADAGGDISSLDLSGTGRTQWSRAIRLLQNGGGNISPLRLIQSMLRTFGKNYELQYLHALLQRAPHPKDKSIAV